MSSLEAGHERRSPLSVEAGFEDPEQPGRFFVCPHCNAIEGLLASFPGLATQIEVHRLPFARPRTVLVEILGEQHQSLPVLVFDESRPVPEDAGVANGRRFIDSSERILRYLAERYAFPHLHQSDRDRWRSPRLAPVPSAAP